MGFDYGMGQTNVDRATGIRFGVISEHEVLQSWTDSSDANYGAPHCPKCGNECRDTTDPQPDDGYEDEYDCAPHSCGDYSCDDCRYQFDSEDAFGDEPLRWELSDGEYIATQGGDGGDIFVIKSPYYTRAEYCSPCAPGAAYLMSPSDDGPKAYCFGHDWFEGGRAPYPVYSVATDELVSP